MQFYRFIRVKTGIEGRKKEERREVKGRGSARNFGEERKAEKKGEEEKSARVKGTRINRKKQLRWGGLRPEGGRFFTPGRPIDAASVL